MDNPDLFEELVNPNNNTSKNKFVYFRKTFNTNNFVEYVPLPSTLVTVLYASQGEIVQAYNLYNDGQIFFATEENAFYDLTVTATRGGTEIRTLTASANGEKYQWLFGRRDLYFQYRHSAPATRRIDPSPNNIVDLYILTKQYAFDYQAWIRDNTGKIEQPVPNDTETLQLAYGELENYKTISDTMIYNSARFKPVFGVKSDPALRATFKVIKNPEVVISDNEIKTSVISAVNEFFDVNNWDFGETFYFSELSAFLHNKLTPKINSVIVVPNSTNQQFGGLYQINAEPDEIIISCATVDNIEIIPAITAVQL
jgi:fructose-1,6-bisphosphatase/inositol monophosphatase family enzyme